jgi:hypothetical protein
MQRARQKLPVKLTFLMPKPFHLFVFGLQKLTLDTEQEIKLFFHQHEIRTYDSNAGYAQLKPPLLLEYDDKNEQSVLRFHYAVYNGAGIRRWPLQFTVVRLLKWTV